MTKPVATNAITKLLRRQTIVLLAVLLALAPAYGQPPATGDICEPAGYVIGFFNGVGNTRLQAQMGLSAIRDRLQLGSTYRGEKVDYEVFYNQTGTDREGVTRLEDIAEVFRQRSQELDGALANRWEVFWEALASSSTESSFLERMTARIGRVSTELGNLLGALYADIITKAAAGWSYLLSNPPTSADYAVQHARIKTHALEGRKLLLIAHSQGNLFVNQAYDVALTVTDTSSVKVVHVAPASPTLRGDYLLADLDLVINALRVQGLSSIPANNVELPASHLVTDDASGHTLVETYLNGRRATLPKLKGMVQAALDALETPDSQGSAGFFTVTLTWNGSGDVDLHVFEPSGQQVFYGARQGSSGFLDVDNVTANGPEHYYATCDAARLATGTYRIGINNFRGATGRTATVQVATAAGGEIFSRQLGVGSERGTAGNSSPIPVVSVLVTRDAEGTFGAAIR